MSLGKVGKRWIWLDHRIWDFELRKELRKAMLSSLGIALRPHHIQIMGLLEF